VLPGVLAVSALHEYAGPHHGHPFKHMWILTVVAVAVVVSVAVWIYRRRNGGGGVVAAKPPA
jgi:membrane-associated protein